MSDQMNVYIEYLDSVHWKNLRNEAFKRADVRCENCSSKKNLVGHHMVYRNPLENGVPDDIMCLCRICHESLHRGLTQANLPLPSTRIDTISCIRFFLTTDKPKELAQKRHCGPRTKPSATKRFNHLVRIAKRDLSSAAIKKLIAELEILRVEMHFIE